MNNNYYSTEEPRSRKLKEADTRVKLVDPLLHQSGWSEELIEREYTLSEGQVDIIGDQTKRRKPRWIDYVLRLSPHATPLAVVEAKQETETALSGMEQAKQYAEKVGVPFAYSTNGHEIEEFDFVKHTTNSLEGFPSPQQLSERYFSGAKIKASTEDIKTVLQTPDYTDPSTGFRLRYYQETAVNKSLEAILDGQKRILLNLATGTGKTWIAFNIAWRLHQAKHIRRVLFLADRKFLRDQAHNNAFAPFGDARSFIPTSIGRATQSRDVYFSIYQALYAETQDGKRLYQEYPPDFFDLIIIDECHRSGFGTWNEILQHFDRAIHLGMTATPKRKDNIDTYEYFGKPVYTYSYGQGVADGYLAPFLVHRVLTNIDKEGHLNLQDARTQGAQVIVSAEADLKDTYQQEEFEKTVSLPDRTKAIAQHLAKTLRLFDPMHKTMVFCVSMDHAEEMASYLQNEFAELGYDNFAVPIISRTNDIREDVYEDFRDSDKKLPVVATTVDLLTTGVDVPSVKNVVIVKPISSKIVFKQIIGRGSRIDAVSDKRFFRIIDYVNATRLFDDWEKIPEPPQEEEPDAFDKYLSGVVVEKEEQSPIEDAKITIQTRPNEQDYATTGSDGRFSFSNLPNKPIQVFVKAKGYRTRQVTVTPFDTEDEFIAIELLLEKVTPKPKVKVENLPVHISEEKVVVLEGSGKSLKVTEYIKYAKNKIKKEVSRRDDLLAIWTNREQREKFLEELTAQSIYPKLLAQLLNHPDVDAVDLLSSVAFGTTPLTRDERVEAFENLQQKFLAGFSEDAQEIIFALLDKYRLGGIEEITDSRVFRLPPFDKMGYIRGVAKRFGSVDELRNSIDTLEKLIYQQ